MTRPLRIEFDGAVYHVMARGAARMHAFVDDEDRRSFLDIVGEMVVRGDWVVHAFCLLLYALRKYSALRSAEIARRQGRTAGAVTLAVKHLDEEARITPALAQDLQDLQQAVLAVGEGRGKA